MWEREFIHLFDVDYLFIDDDFAINYKIYTISHD